MKWNFLSSLAVAALTALSAAQSSTTPSPSAQTTAPAQSSSAAGQSTNQIPAGTVIPVELSKSADAKKLKPGEAIEARTAIDVLSHGKVLTPRNTKIIGHVIEVKAHSKASPDSKIGVSFDGIVMKDGREVPLQAVVQAVGRPLRSAALSGNDPVDISTGMSLDPGGVGPMGGSMPSRSPSPGTSRASDTASGPSARATPESTVAPLGPTSQGVIGMKKFSLSVAGQASVISSRTDNVHLDSGTQLILRTQ